MMIETLIIVFGSVLVALITKGRRENRQQHKDASNERSNAEVRILEALKADVTHLSGLTDDAQKIAHAAVSAAGAATQIMAQKALNDDMRFTSVERSIAELRTFTQEAIGDLRFALIPFVQAVDVPPDEG